MAKTLTQDILVAALAGMKLEQQTLEEKIAHVQNMLDETNPAKRTATQDAPTGKSRKRSAAVRRRMAEAQRARYARLRGESERSSESAPEPPKKKRRMSAKARAAIGAATRKRWAMKRAEAKNAKSTVTTKKVAKTTKKSAGPKKAVKKASKATKKTVAKKSAAPAPAVAEAAV